MNTQSSETLNPLVESLSELEKREEAFISSGRKLLSMGNLYSFDLFCTAILNRSLNLVRGFIDLMNGNNFIAAAPLIRIHLDTLLRLYSFSLIDDNINQLISRIAKGESLRSFKGRNGLPFTDKNLVESISLHEQYNWVKPLYSKLNGFVHLSEMHILSCSTLDETSGTIRGIIRKSDEFIPEKDKKASITFMIMISDGIISLIDEWSIKKLTYKPEES